VTESAVEERVESESVSAAETAELQADEDGS